MMDIMYQRTMKELREALESYTKRVTASPEAAKAALVRSGIYLENGELSPNYKPPKPKKPSAD